MWLNPLLVLFGLLIAQGCVAISGVVVNNHLVETNQKRNRIQFPTPLINNHLMAKFAEFMQRATATKAPRGEISEMDAHKEYNRLLKFHPNQGLLPFRNFNEYIITKNNFEQQLTTAFPTVGTNNYFDYLISLQNHQNKDKPSYSYNEEYQYPPEQQYEDPVYYPASNRNKTIDKYFPLITSLNNHYLHQPITLSSASIEDAMEDPNDEYNSLYPATTPLNEAYVEIPKRRPHTMAPTRPSTLFGYPTTVYTPTNYATATKSPSVTILSGPSYSSTTQEPPSQYFSSTTEEPVVITIQTNYTLSTISPDITHTSNTLNVITVTPAPRPKKKKKKKKKPTPTPVFSTEATIQKANVRPKLPTPTTTKAPIRIFHNYFIMNCSVLAKDTEKLKELMNKQSALVAGVTITENPEDAATGIANQYYGPSPASIQIFPQNLKKYVATPLPPVSHSSGPYKKTKKYNKPKKKVVYVDPPGVGEIKNVMDSVYGMMEDVFTDEKVVLDDSDEDARELRMGSDNSTDFNLPEDKATSMRRLSNTLMKRKYRVGSVDSSQYYDDDTILSDQDQDLTEPLQDEESPDEQQEQQEQQLPERDIVVGHDSEELVSEEPQQEVIEEPVFSYSTSTRRPVVYKVTPAGDGRQSKESKETLTTKIHVTSEYIPPTKATASPLRLPNRRKNKYSEEDDSGSEEYDDYESGESGSEEKSGEDRSESEERDYDDGNDDESEEESYGDSNTSESEDSDEELEEKNESLGLEDYNSIQFEYDNDDSSSEDATVFEFPDSSEESPDYLAKSKNPSGDPSNDTLTNTTNVEALQKKLRRMDARRKKKVKKCEKDKKPKGKKNKKKKKKKSKKKTKRKKKKAVKPPPDSLEEYEDEYASDFFGFMAEFFTTVGRYVPFFGPAKKPVVEEEEEEEARGTTPRIESMRKPKKPSYSSEKFYDLTNVEDDGQAEEKQAVPWYYPSFVYYNDYENEVPATTTESSWLDSWFPWNSWFDDPEPVATTTEAADESWFPSLNLFGAAPTASTTTTTTTTTTPQPPPVNIPFLTVSNPIKNPEKWLSILAQQLKVSTTTARPTPEEPDNVPPKPVKAYYDNYQLWRLNPRTRENVDYLDDYRRSPEGQKFKWWRGPSLRGATDVLVPPSMVQIFKDFLDDESISQEVVIRDLQKVIEYENPRITKREQIETEAVQGHPMTFYRYHRYADMLKYLDFIQRKFSKHVELIHIGRSYEGRPLIVVKVKFPNSDEPEPEPRVKNYRKGGKRKEKRSGKPAVFVEAGAHGREWISSASGLWIVDKLLRVIDDNDTAQIEVLKAVDWFIMPVLNPDGYEFSHEFDRMWQKTRSMYSDKPSGIISTALNWLPLSKESEPRCFGVNLNRNWDFQWNQGSSTSSFECSDNYSGPKAFSETEAKSLSKWLVKHKKDIKIYISLHSYGQLITYPSSEQDDGYQQDELFDMAKVALDALRSTGSPSRYIIDNSNELLYPHSSGAADAFAMHQLGIKYSFTLELRDTGTHGFLLPSSYIESSAQEAYEIIKGMVDYI